MRTTSGVIALVALLSLIAGAATQGQGTLNCQNNNFNGKAYNLWDLNVAVSGRAQMITDSRQDYWFLPCGDVSSVPGCGTFSYDKTPAFCQKDSRATAEYHGCGTAASPEWQTLPSDFPAGTEGFTIFYNKDGEISTDTKYPGSRNTTIDFVCDINATNGGTGALAIGRGAIESPVHSYHLQWNTKYACPITAPPNNGGGDKSGGISVGWILIIIFIGILFLYFVIGMGVQKFYFKNSGVEIIPNHSFWLALPGLVKDGNVFVVRKLLGLCGRGGGYNAV